MKYAKHQNFNNENFMKIYNNHQISKLRKKKKIMKLYSNCPSWFLYDFNKPLIY